MAGETQDNNWPLPKFYFIVDWGSIKNIPFQEVSGLETETQPIDIGISTVLNFQQLKCPEL
jgi:hypothetical protein